MSILKYKVLVFSIFFIFNSLLSHGEILIEGVLKNGDTNMGGIKIEFNDSENKILETETDIFGYFSIVLEAKKYSISLKDYTLILSENSDKIYDFKDKNNKNFLSLESSYKPGFISGQILDNFNNSIPFSTINITSGKFSKNIISDELGYFSSELPHGIFRVSAFSEGFIPKSLVRNLPPASSIPNLSVIMSKIFYSVEGYVTNGIEPLENIEIKLISENGNILKRGYTSENGKFFLKDVPSLEKIYILIESDNFFHYQSQPVKIEKNIKDFYIPLVKKKENSF